MINEGSSCIKFHLAFHLAFVCSPVYKPHKHGILFLYFYLQKTGRNCMKTYNLRGFQAFFTYSSNLVTPTQESPYFTGFFVCRLAFHLALFCDILQPIQIIINLILIIIRHRDEIILIYCFQYRCTVCPTPAAHVCRVDIRYLQDGSGTCEVVT